MRQFIFLQREWLTVFDAAAKAEAVFNKARVIVILGDRAVLTDRALAQEFRRERLSAAHLEGLAP